MKNSKLTQKIMKKVVTFEKKRVIIWILRAIVLVFGFGLIGLIVLGFVSQELARTGSFELLTLFGEDKEVIAEFWQETVLTFWEELPKREVFILIFSLIITIIIIILAKKRWPIIKRKINGLEKYKKSLNNKNNEK
jgi:uncharacterized membrane protein (DUF485 family)